MGENVRWLASHLGEAFQDQISVGLLAGLAILFLLSLLRQSRTGDPIPWKPLAVSVLVAPVTLALSLFLSPLSDRSESAGAILGLVFVVGVLLAQFVGSVIVVWRAKGSRLVLASGLLCGLWVTFMTAGLSLGLTTGLGRTWK